MAELVYIETKKIYPHPDNPRKDLGDLTELTASIRASGILQNLTVIPGHAMTHGERQKEEAQAAEDRRGEQLKEIARRHRGLREAFIRDYQVTEWRMAAICAFACDAMLSTSWGWDINVELLAELLHLEVDDETTNAERMEMLQDDKRLPWGYKLLATTYAAAEDDRNRYYERNWNSKSQVWEYRHREDEELTNLYKDLERLGYEMSDEEKAMRDGTHGVFR